MLSLNQSLSKEKSCIFYFLVDLGLERETNGRVSVKN